MIKTLINQTPADLTLLVLSIHKSVSITTHIFANESERVYHMKCLVYHMKNKLHKTKLLHFYFVSDHIPESLSHLT